MACTNWLGTLNNPTVDPQEFLQSWHNKANAVYVVGQLEKGAEGTVHIQYFVNFKKPGQRLSYLKKYCSQSHFEMVRTNNGADLYCMKAETRVDGPWEFGTKPLKRNSKTDWDEVFQHAKKGEFDKIPAQV